MSYFRTADPERDFSILGRVHQDILDRLPKCEKCKKPINDDYYFETETEILCEACMISKYRRNTENYFWD